MQPTVSVIIPTYNRANYLKKSLQSAISQTVRDIEIIIINNYSTDNTLEVISSFNDQRIKIINFKNGGVIAKSRNQGMIQSTGRYIAFLDDDDLWCPDKLELQIDYLESHPEFGAVYSNAIIIDEKDNRKGFLINRGQAKEGQVFQYLLGGNFITILTVLMRRELLESVGLFNEEPSLIAVEDYEYWMRTSFKFGFGYIGKPLALYRIHSTSVSKRNSVALLRQKVLRMMLDNSSVAEKYRDKIVSNIERLNFSASVYHWSVSDRVNAKRCARKYISFNLKEIHFLNVLFGVLLYIIINFNFDTFRSFVNVYENKIAKII
ncbi:MAG: glycosyltransferase [Candidatus Methanoperedens sp.]|nr:glycosyltransferase [Candidatus Methanoperedens sp.]